MNKSKVTIAREAIRDKIHDAWDAGLTNIDIRAKDIHSELHWSNNMHTVGAAMFCMYHFFKDKGEEFHCSCEIIDFPKWTSSLTNLYGSNLTMRFYFPEPQFDIHNFLFPNDDEKYKKVDDPSIIVDRCIHEMNKLIIALETNGNLEEFIKKYPELKNVASEHMKKWQAQIQEIEQEAQFYLEQATALKGRLFHEKD